MLANCFEVLQTVNDKEVGHEFGYNGLTPVVTDKLSLKGNKNGNGQNWETLTQDCSNKVLDIDQLDVNSLGNKNKTGKSLGQSNLDNGSSYQGPNVNVQHVTNGKQHTLCYFLGNKNGIGSKLGGVPHSVHTATSSDNNNKYSTHINPCVYSHEALSSRFNKNRNGTKLGNMATL